MSVDVTEDWFWEGNVVAAKDSEWQCFSWHRTETWFATAYDQNGSRAVTRLRQPAALPHLFGPPARKPINVGR